MDNFLYYWLKFVAILTQLIALLSKYNGGSDSETSTTRRDKVKLPFDGFDFLLPDIPGLK
ncbi:MAG: hypothetical protein IJM45_09480 [Clostridia bacterium]|nr:hypothetical protein [Clostridia bacterium]MBQ9880648.1 hypothetical protein [Clostridia bacterium]